jgi:carboxyl-terminal processing protease
MKKLILRILSYILVAALASVLTLGFWGSDYSKIEEIKDYIDLYFVGEADMSKAEDAAAAAMIYALGDKWSYYISAEEYASYEENKNNVYVGIGITIVVREDGTATLELNEALAWIGQSPAQEDELPEKRPDFPTETADSFACGINGCK